MMAEGRAALREHTEADLRKYVLAFTSEHQTVIAI